MANGQLIYVSPTGDPSHGGTNRVSINTVDADYSDATLIHESSSETVDTTDVYVDFIKLDLVNITDTAVTVKIYWGSDFPIYQDVPPRGSPLIYVHETGSPLAKGNIIKATILSSGNADDVHVGVNVARMQQAA